MSPLFAARKLVMIVCAVKLQKRYVIPNTVHITCTRD